MGDSQPPGGLSLYSPRDRKMALSCSAFIMGEGKLGERKIAMAMRCRVPCLVCYY